MTNRMFVMAALVGSTLFSAAVPAAAQVQQVASRPAEGSHAWGSDGWCYVVQGGRWYRTGFYRSFPMANNPHVFDLYENGRFSKRVNVGDPRYYQEMPAANFAATSYVSWVRHPARGQVTAATVEVFVKNWGRWVTLQQVQALTAQQAAQPAYNPNNPLLAASVVGGTQTLAPGSGTVMNPNTAATLAKYGVTQQMMESHNRNMQVILAPRCVPGQWCR